MPEVLAVAEAKKHFPAIIRESSEALKVFRVGNAQRRDAPRAVILGEEAIRTLLGDLKFTPEWEEDKEQGLWSAVVPELDIFGQGATREEARDQLLAAARDYANVYLEDVPFYFKVGRRGHFPYVLAVSLVADQPEKLASLLGV